MQEEKKNTSSWIRQKLHFSNMQTHTFHLVTESPWPLFGACAALNITVAAVMNLHGFETYGLFKFGLFMLILVASCWWRDVVREALFLGYHTKIVVKGLKIGMILFIVSEVMFFFSFFWAFFHASLSPSIVLGSVWPPIGINVLNPLHLPLLNTFILLVSGVTVTYSHYCVICFDKFSDSQELNLEPHIDTNSMHYQNWLNGKLPWYTYFPVWVRDVYFFIKCKLNSDFAARYEEEQKNKQTKANIVNHMNALQPYLEIISDAQLFLVATILLAFEFTCCQLIEYYTALFYINDGIYGSTFYVATGFHGLHVLIGSIFLFICFLRMYAEHFLVDHHVGFEMAIWYWHFVDVVWLVLYAFIYCWSAGF